MLLRAVGVALALSCATATSAQELKLLPVDEGATDATWPRFKARLIEALARRDQQFLLDLVDRKVRNTSGIEGQAEFKKLWEPQSADSPLWTELPKLLFLGSVFVKRDAKSSELCAPYVYYKWPENAPGNPTGAIVAKETLLKTDPAADSRTLAALSYDLVTVIDWEVADKSKESPQKWVKLKAGAR